MKSIHIASLKTAILASFMLFLFCDSIHADDPIVTLASGTLEGSPMGDAGAVFLGIPYAAPPVGEFRWKAPQVVVPWSGVRLAKRFAPSAMQNVSPEGFLPWTKEFVVQNEVSEDCLYLNVWTPRMKSTAKLPVLVFIHGGAFTGGSGEVPLYDGSRLAKQGVVAVTFNYRLGVFGFFAHPELTEESPHKASGNYGLMDQIAALRWVRENIGAFGGDPRRVTIWGQSAGAWSVGLLLLSEEAKGLFQGAVANSGIGMMPASTQSLKEAEGDGVKALAEHHVKDIKSLRDLPAAELLKWKSGMPITDGWILTEAPGKLRADGNGSAVPIMTGYTADDARLDLVDFKTMDAWNSYTEKTFARMSSEFKKLYPVRSVDEIRQVALTAAQDRERVSLILFAEEQIKQGRPPVYSYFFTRAIPWPQHPEFGAFHSGDLPYFFDNLKIMDRPWEPVDDALAKIMSAYLVNFAANGNPNGEGLPRWNPVDPKSPGTLELGADVKPIPVADADRIAFWRRVLTSEIAGNFPFL